MSALDKARYAKLLLDPRWLSRRLEIIERDDCECTACFSTSELHVHHHYYENGKAPWEYPDSALVTLCDYCHGAEHEQQEWMKESLNDRRSGKGFVLLGTILEGVLKSVEGHFRAQEARVA